MKLSSVAPFIGRKYQHDEETVIFSIVGRNVEKIPTGFTGRVVEICAKQGDTVNKGDVIALYSEERYFCIVKLID